MFPRFEELMVINLKNYVDQAILYGIFDEVEGISGDLYGKFRISDPFTSEVDFVTWKALQTKLPIWIARCKTHQEFYNQAKKIVGIIKGMERENVLDKIRAEYSKVRATN